MVSAILAIIAGLLAAIPIAWKWSQARAEKKAKESYEQDLAKIRDNILAGNHDAVATELDRLLGP